jgi:DNA polymerase alpha subunit A
VISAYLKLLQMASRAARLAELRALRASGKTAAHSYVVEDEDQLYDEVNDEDYKKIVRSRLDEDDFVVDDNGEGYVDDGREEWDNDQGYYDSESEGDARPRGKSGMNRFYYSVFSAHL